MEEERKPPVGTGNPEQGSAPCDGMSNGKVTFISVLCWLFFIVTYSLWWCIIPANFGARGAAVTCHDSSIRFYSCDDDCGVLNNKCMGEVYIRRISITVY